MFNSYTQDQIWERFEKLPKELKFAILSEKTAASIDKACNNLGREKISTVAKAVGDVLLGILSMDDFEHRLSKELKIDEEDLQRILTELDSAIFSQIKPLISSFSKEIEDIGNKKFPLGRAVTKSNKKNDDYREPIK